MHMPSISFEPISIDKQVEYRHRCHLWDPMPSDYSFLNLFGWTDAYGIDWAWESELIWIRQRFPETKFWAPVGPWDQVDWNALFTDKERYPRRFVRVPEQLVAIWRSQLGDRIQVHECRGDWDYLYAMQDLIELKGNRFHKKKNLLSQFKKRYEYQFHLLDEHLKNKALDMQKDWCEWKDCESLDILVMENKAIRKVFDHWNEFSQILGGALIVEDQMVAYTIAEPYGKDTLLIHFEKGKPEYKGIYQAINQIFLEFIASKGYRFELVNREQDLDNPGLRKAKLSYHPVDYIKKYNVVIS